MDIKEIKVLDKGLVRLVDYFGSDQSIVQMARVSYGDGTKTVNEDKGLIEYLIRHKHTSPIEGTVVKLHIKLPIFVARQLIRHRTASLNEVSFRYSKVTDDYYVPSEWREQSITNKQGSKVSTDLSTDDHDMLNKELRELCNLAYDKYQSMLSNNIACNSLKRIS